jgi:hypothetical protein
VLQEQMENAGAHPRDLGDGGKNFARHEMESTRARLEFDDGLMEQHGRSTFRLSVVTL